MTAAAEFSRRLRESGDATAAITRTTTVTAETPDGKALTAADLQKLLDDAYSAGLNGSAVLQALDAHGYHAVSAVKLTGSVQR